VLLRNSYDSCNPQCCNDGTLTLTPSGWQWVSSVTAIDPANSSNIFRGNVTTNYGMDMTHSMCYATTGAVIRSTNGGHTSTTQTSATTNYTAPTAITTGSLTTTLSWDNMLRPTGETGPNGDGVSIGYDSASRPATTYTPNGAYVTYTYSTSPPQNTATMHTDDPNTTGRKTVTKLDGLGRAIEVDSIDASGVTQSIVQSQYAVCGCSPMGKLSKTSRPYKPGDPIYWTTYNYDGVGRTLSVVAPDGASTATYSYAGNTVTTTDPAGNWKKFTMDAFGNLTTVVEPDSSQTNTNNQATTTYTYDALNHLTNVSMPRRMPGGNVVTQTRTFNYLVGSSISAYPQSATNPESGTVSYTYGSDGALGTKTGAMNQTLYYYRDSYGRVTQVQHSNPNDSYGNPVLPTTIRTTPTTPTPSTTRSRSTRRAA
jgi:YD repeat-containing protein